MSDIVVKDLEPDLIERLKERAATLGVSPGEELKRIIRDALSRAEVNGHQALKDVLLQMPDAGDDEDFERSRDYPSAVDLS